MATTEQRPTTDGGELTGGFDSHPGVPWHPDWTPPTEAVDDLIRPEETPTVEAPPVPPLLPREDRDTGERLADWPAAEQAVDDLALLGETQTVPASAEETPTVEAPPVPPLLPREDRDTGELPMGDLLSPEETPTVEAPPPLLPREDRDTGEGPSVPVEGPADDLLSPEETPTVEAPPPSLPREDGDTGERLADWLTPTEAGDDLALLEETQTVPTSAEETPTVEAPRLPPSLPREDRDTGERPADDLMPPEEAQVVAARAEETLTITLPVFGTYDITATENITIESAAGLQERVRRARFLLGLLGLFVVYVTTALALSAIAPTVGLGWTSVVITSGSMSPTFDVGDVVVAAPHDGHGLDPGTVVVFSDPARPGLLTHRIESVNPDGSYVTKGDANAQPDSTPLRPEQVVGEGRLLVPSIGLPLVWYWAGAWGKLAIWAAGTLLALWLARYALLQRYEPRAQPEESGHVPG